jgi:hypothetical protein
MPPASTDCTSDIGATDSAATWKTHAVEAITIPIVNGREPNSNRAVRNGLRISTGGAAHAPRYLNRKPRFAAREEASASGIPREVITKPEAEPVCLPAASHCYTAAPAPFLARST